MSFPFQAAANAYRFVEMLEEQRDQLVVGLRELYNRLQSGHGWPGEPLRKPQGGHPLTHDILERLDLLHPTSDSSSSHGDIEEDCNRMQQKLLEKGAPYTPRQGSVSSNSDHGISSSSTYGGAPTTNSFPFSDLLVCNDASQTSPMNSRVPTQSQIQPLVKQEAPLASPTFIDTDVVDPSALQRTAWTGDWTMMDEPVDFSMPMYNLDSFGHFDQTTMMLNPIVVNSVLVLPDTVMDGVDPSDIIYN